MAVLNLARVDRRRLRAPNTPGKATKTDLKAQVWSLDYGVPIAEPRSGWNRIKSGVAKFGRRIKKTFGPDRALEGLNEPIPADVLLARPIATKRN